MTYMLSTVTALILESDINQVWRRKKMMQAISRMSGHYIVCGVGRVGSNVAHELVTTGRECVVMDSDLQHLETFLEKYPEQPYMHADATDNDVLLAAGVMRARGIFAVAADDSQNLVISLSAKQLNPKLRVVARCHDLKNVEKTRRAGADEIVSPDFTGGLRIVSAMVRPHVVSFLDEMLKTEDALRMEEFPIPAEFAGQAAVGAEPRQPPLRIAGRPPGAAMAVQSRNQPRLARRRRADGDDHAARAQPPGAPDSGRSLNLRHMSKA